MTLLGIVLLSVRCKQEVNLRTEVGVQGCLVILGIYLFLLSIEDSSDVVLGFIRHTQILFFKELDVVINFFPYICKCGTFFIFLIMDVAVCFFYFVS